MNELVKETTNIVKEEAKGGIKAWIVNHESVLLTGGGIIFNGFAIFYSVKDSKFIMEKIDECNKMLEHESDPKKRKEFIKLTAKEIALPVGRIVALFGAGTACNITNTVRMNKKITTLNKKVADLTGALSLSTAALAQANAWKEQATRELERDKMWQESAKKQMGEEKTSEVEKEVATKEVEKNPPNEAISGVNDEPQDMFHYYISNTQAWKWSSKSPEDIKGWAYDRGYDLVSGNCSGDILNFNEFLYWLTEDQDEIYQIQGAENNKDWYWRANDATGQYPTDLVSIDVTSVIDNKGKPQLVIHCNFLPDRYSSFR